MQRRGTSFLYGTGVQGCLKWGEGSAGKESQRFYGVHCGGGREGGGKDYFSREQELEGEACARPRF